jgi:hypothetical protein
MIFMVKFTVEVNVNNIFIGLQLEQDKAAQYARRFIEDSEIQALQQAGIVLIPQATLAKLIKELGIEDSNDAYEAHEALSHHKVYLDGKDARIHGFGRKFAWETVKRVIENGGQFKS